jgi:methionyl-tRNA formyltransferase
MSATGVHNLVRALARPYVGAHCVHAGQEVKVWRTRIADAGSAARDAEPGRVLAREGDLLTVKCGEDAIQLVEHELAALPDVGSYM